MDKRSQYDFQIGTKDRVKEALSGKYVPNHIDTVNRDVKNYSQTNFPDEWYEEDAFERTEGTPVDLEEVTGGLSEGQLLKNIYANTFDLVERAKDHGNYIRDTFSQTEHMEHQMINILKVLRNLENHVSNFTSRVVSIEKSIGMMPETLSKLSETLATLDNTNSTLILNQSKIGYLNNYNNLKISSEKFCILRPEPQYSTSKFINNWKNNNSKFINKNINNLQQIQNNKNYLNNYNKNNSYKMEKKGKKTHPPREFIIKIKKTEAELKSEKKRRVGGMEVDINPYNFFKHFKDGSIINDSGFEKEYDEMMKKPPTLNTLRAPIRGSEHYQNALSIGIIKELKEIKCKICGADNHTEKGCIVIYCKLCHQIGHFRNECLLAFRCQYCLLENKDNHLTNNCTSVEAVKNKLTCHKCGQVGHLITECNYIPPKQPIKTGKKNFKRKKWNKWHKKGRLPWWKKNKNKGFKK